MILFSNQFPCSRCANEERTEGFWGLASGRVKRKMINSLCGSLGSAKTENSCSKLPPTSSNESVSEFKNSLPLHPPPALPSDQERSSLTPPSLSFPNLKFEADTEIEVQSPDTSMWDSFFSEHLDSDFMMTSPLTPSYSYNYICAQGQTLTGCSPPRSSSAVGALSTSHKWKGLSPLHKVFTSPNNEFNVQRGSLNLPAIGELLGDFEEDGFHSFATAAKLSEMDVFDHMSSSLPEALNALALPNSSSFCGSSSEQSAPCSSLYVNDGNEYQMGLAQKSLQQDQHEQEIKPQQLHSTTSTKLPENEGEIFRHSLTVPVSTASELEHDSGLQLVHLLLACAEAMAKEDYMLARRYLQHLSGVVSPLGDSMQRVAACFTTALSDRLAATLISPKPIASNPTFPSFPPNSLEILRVYQIVYQACPYIKFAHFTANQAIFEAFEGEGRVHVIDLDILQGYQWPAFMQALAARSNNPPFLRITGVDQNIESVRETGRCLTELAHSLNVPFEFHAVGEQLEDLKPHMFNRRVGEALAVNSVNRLHRVQENSLGNLLVMIRDQAPNIVTLVEQEASHNGPYFLGRFLEALHYYSAIFDSLDATFPPNSTQRAKVEQYIFAKEINNIVACEGADRTERHERLEKWRKIMEGKGFKGVALSANAVTQSKILLGLYSCDAYRLTEDKGCLLLGWQDRPLIAASAWRC